MTILRKMVNEMYKDTSIEEIVNIRDVYEKGCSEYNFMDKIKTMFLLDTDDRMEESIVVIDNDIFNRKYKINGLITDVGKVNSIKEYLDNHTFNVTRARAEYSPIYRQLVSQFVIRCGDDIFLARKKSKNIEKRLIGRVELIGGHLNNISDYYNELTEEIQLGEDNTIFNIEMKAIIKLDKDGCVEDEHMGLVFIVDVINKNVSIHEDEQFKLDGFWINKNEISSLGNLNTWASLILGYIEF